MPDDPVRPDGTYGARPLPRRRLADRVEEIRIEAETQRRDDPQTARHSLPPPVVELSERESRVIFRTDRLEAWWKVLRLVGGILAALVAGLGWAMHWLDGRIGEQVAPVREEVRQIHRGVDALLVKQGLPTLDLMAHSDREGER